MDCFVSSGTKSARSVREVDVHVLVCNTPQHMLSSFYAANLSRYEADGAAMMRQCFSGTVAQWLCRPRSALGGPGQGPAPLLPPAGRECCPHCSVPLIACIQPINQSIKLSIKPSLNPLISSSIMTACGLAWDQNTTVRQST